MYVSMQDLNLKNTAITTAKYSDCIKYRYRTWRYGQRGQTNLTNVNLPRTPEGTKQNNTGSNMKKIPLFLQSFRGLLRNMAGFFEFLHYYHQSAYHPKLQDIRFLLRDALFHSSILRGCPRIVGANFRCGYALSLFNAVS